MSGPEHAAPATEPTDPPHEVARRMVEATTELLTGLTVDQRDRATWEFPSDQERRVWFYTPTDHGGLPLADMNSVQHRLLYRLLAAALSPAGFNTTAAVIGLENILDHTERFQVDFGRDRGRDPLLYWIAVFGEPTLEGTWGWRFGGHHVSLNFTMVDGVITSATPCFLGADPASVPLLGPHVHRPLGGIEDLARELARSLHGDQAAAALVSPVAPPDIVTSNRTVLQDGDRPLPLPLIWRQRFEHELDQRLAAMDAAMATGLGVEEAHLSALAFSTRPKGVAAADLAPDQQEILRQLLGTYVGRVHDDLADRELAKFAGDRLDSLHFLWAGGLETGVPHYFRIQGNDLLAEYDNAQRDGNHVHTVWRDLQADFGGDPLAQHYATGHDH